MVQIDYEITIFYKAFFIKKSFWGCSDNSCHPPCNCSGGQAPPDPPVGVWGPNTAEKKTFEHKENNQAPHPTCIPTKPLSTSVVYRES